MKDKGGNRLPFLLTALVSYLTNKHELDVSIVSYLTNTMN